jgi:hypothetical protein
MLAVNETGDEKRRAIREQVELLYSLDVVRKPKIEVWAGKGNLTKVKVSGNLPATSKRSIGASDNAPNVS